MKEWGKREWGLIEAASGRGEIVRASYLNAGYSSCLVSFSVLGRCDMVRRASMQEVCKKYARRMQETPWDEAKVGLAFALWAEDREDAVLPGVLLLRLATFWLVSC